MLTLFSIPKAFSGHIGMIQRNAIISWTKLIPKCEIILLGADNGIKEIALELELIHIPNVKTNNYDTPRLDSAFALAQQYSTNNKMIYINSDIILFQDMVETIKINSINPSIITGQRWDYEVHSPIDFNNPNWAADLKIKIESEMNLHNISGKDYFVFEKNTIDMPPFIVGRPGWDDWLLFHMRSKGIPIIDGTKAISVIHQNHNYSHSKYGESKRVGGPERKANSSLIGSFSNIISLKEADWVLDGSKLVRPKGINRVFSLLSYCSVWRKILAIKRRLLYYLEIFINR